MKFLKLHSIREMIIFSKIRYYIGLLGWKESCFDFAKSIISNNINTTPVEQSFFDAKGKKDSTATFLLVDKVAKNNTKTFEIVFQKIENAYKELVNLERDKSNKIFNYMIFTAAILTIFVSIGTAKWLYFTLFSVPLFLFILSYFSRWKSYLDYTYYLKMALLPEIEFKKKVTYDYLVDSEFLHLRIELISKIINFSEKALVIILLFSLLHFNLCSTKEVPPINNSKELNFTKESKQDEGKQKPNYEKTSYGSKQSTTTKSTRTKN